MISNKMYDVLKPVAMYVLPALAALYGGLAQVWSLPYAEQIVQTIMAFDVFMGLLLGVSKSQYQTRLKNALGYSYVEQLSLPDVDSNLPKWYMSKELYDGLYWVAQVLLPGLAALYITLGPIWKLPFPEQIAASIALVDTFLGVVLSVSTYELNKVLAKRNSSRSK